MAMTAREYRQQLQALLPRGPAWPRDEDAVLTQLLDAMADELARLDARSDDLLTESDPRATSELLADWERVAGLPDSCSSNPVALSPGRYSVPLSQIAEFARATTATYLDAGVLETAAVDVPRFEAGQLVIEAAGTNVLLYSDQINNAPWWNTQCSVTPNSAAAPDGTLTADKLVLDATAATQHYIGQSVIVEADQDVVYSVFAKAAELSWLTLQINDANHDYGVVFNLAGAGSLGLIYGTGTVEDYGITNIGGGWYRCWIHIVPTSAAATVFVVLAEGYSDTIIDGDGVSGLYLWGAQLEHSPVLTSYIPTAAAAASRAADICSIWPAPTVAERRNALAGRLAGAGGQSRQYFIDLASSLGYAVMIDEFDPFDVNLPVDAPLNGIEWRFAWRVNAPNTTVSSFTVESGVNEPLADWGNELLECAIAARKPAHTHVLFAYG